MQTRIRRMLQTATYWGPGTDDGLGGITYPSPYTIDVRWQQKAELFRDANANEVISSAVVYVSEPVEIEGWMALGDETATADPRNADGAYQIRQLGDSPSLKADETLRKAWL